MILIQQAQLDWVKNYFEEKTLKNVFLMNLEYFCYIPSKHFYFFLLTRLQTAIVSTKFLAEKMQIDWILIPPLAKIHAELYVNV